MAKIIQFEDAKRKLRDKSRERAIALGLEKSVSKLSWATPEEYIKKRESAIDTLVKHAEELDW